jgi:glucokinase
MAHRSWLVADLGGTNARFAIADPDTRNITDEAVVPTGSATTLVDLVEQYLQRHVGPRPTAASFACAGPSSATGARRPTPGGVALPG